MPPSLESLQDEGEDDKTYIPAALRLEWTAPCPKDVKDAFNHIHEETDQQRAEGSIVILKYLEESIVDDHVST